MAYHKDNMARHNMGHNLRQSPQVEQWANPIHGNPDHANNHPHANGRLHATHAPEKEQPLYY